MDPGACSGGTDTSAYSLSLSTTEPDAVVHVAVAKRRRSHTPGSGYTEHVETESGSGGAVASLVASDQTFPAPGTVAAEGSFDGSVDWAAVAVEIH